MGEQSTGKLASRDRHDAGRIDKRPQDHQGKERKSEERESKREEKEERLHAQRQELGKAIALARAEKSTNEAPSPPEPTAKPKAPPANLEQDHRQETPPKSPQRSSRLDENI